MSAMRNRVSCWTKVNLIPHESSTTAKKNVVSSLCLQCPIVMWTSNYYSIYTKLLTKLPVKNLVAILSDRWDDDMKGGYLADWVRGFALTSFASYCPGPGSDYYKHKHLAINRLNFDCKSWTQDINNVALKSDYCVNTGINHRLHSLDNFKRFIHL